MSRTAREWAAPPAMPEDHYVSSRVYVDPDLFQEEQERILKRAWKFACHERLSRNTFDMSH